MNKHIKYIGAALLATMTLAACSPDEFEGADQNGKATVEGLDVTVVVDQATNTVTMTSPHLTQAYPYWSIISSRSADGETDFHSTLEKATRVFALAGDKKVVYRVGNRNGFSDGAIEKTIHIDNSITDLTTVANAIASEEGKAWRVAYEQEAYFGYGPTGSDGSSTWVATATDKGHLPDYAMFDDVVTLSLGTSADRNNYTGTVSYAPGDDGKVQLGGNGSGDCKAISAKSGNYTLKVNGDDVLLTLDAGIPMPFVPSETFLNAPTYRVDAYSKDLLVLVANDGGRAWRIVLAPATASEEFGWTGFTEGTNLLAGSNASLWFWFANSSWSQIDDPVHSGTIDEGFSFTMNACGSERWQAQVQVQNTGVTLSSDKTYDFSFVIVSDAKQDVQATIKPVKDGDDNTFWSDALQTIHPGTNVIAFSDCAGFDGDFKLAMDYAGAPEGTTFVLQNFFLTEHQAGNIAPFDCTSDNNVWKQFVESAMMPTFYYWAGGDDWHSEANPDIELEGTTYTITSNANTKNQWQGQIHWQKLPVEVTADDTFDFSCVLQTTGNFTATLKFTDASDDNSFVFSENVTLTAGEKKVVVLKDCKLPEGAATASAMTFVLDLGGIQAGETFKIGQIAINRK